MTVSHKIIALTRKTTTEKPIAQYPRESNWVVSLIEALYELHTTNNNFIQAVSMTHARDRKSHDNYVLPWHFGKLGIRNFPEWEACFAPWRPCFDFKHCRLCAVATFFRYLFCCSLDCRVQGDFCSRQRLFWGTCYNSGRNLLQTLHKYSVSSLYLSASTRGTLFFHALLRLEIHGSKEKQGGSGTQCLSSWVPVSALGADSCLHSPEVQNVFSLMLLCSYYHLWDVAMAQLRE